MKSSYTQQNAAGVGLVPIGTSEYVVNHKTTIDGEPVNVQRRYTSGEEAEAKVDAIVEEFERPHDGEFWWVDRGAGLEIGRVIGSVTLRVYLCGTEEGWELGKDPITMIRRLDLKNQEVANATDA